MKSSNIDKLKSIWVAICTCALILPIGVHTYIPYTSHFHYYCRDHLGDNRVVVGEEGGIAKAKAEMVKKKLEKDDD